MAIEEVSRVIDPDTGLDTDVRKHSNLLADLLSMSQVRDLMVAFGRATPEGIETQLNLINHAHRAGVGRLGPCFARSRGCVNGHTPDWWKQFAFTVRSNLFLVLTHADTDGRGLNGGPDVRKNAAMQLAWRYGAPYRAVNKDLFHLATTLGWWLETHSAMKTNAGLLIVRGNA